MPERVGVPIPLQYQHHAGTRGEFDPDTGVRNLGSTEFVARYDKPPATLGGP